MRRCEIVTSERKPSISYVQRRLKIGYNRAARMLEAMELAGIVGPLQSNGGREVLAPPSPGSDAARQPHRPRARPSFRCSRRSRCMPRPRYPARMRSTGT